MHHMVLQELNVPFWQVRPKTDGAACCRRRIELVQDLEFPEACHRIKATSDGKFLFATGIHPPRLRCYELSELSMKFERHFDSEVVDFQVRGGWQSIFNKRGGYRSGLPSTASHCCQPHSMLQVMSCHFQTHAPLCGWYIMVWYIYLPRRRFCLRTTARQSSCAVTAACSSMQNSAPTTAHASRALGATWPTPLSTQTCSLWALLLRCTGAIKQALSFPAVGHRVGPEYCTGPVLTAGSPLAR